MTASCAGTEDRSDSDVHRRETEGEQLDPVAQLADEFLARLRNREKPAIEDYCRQYPESAPRLRRILSTLLLMEDSGEPDAAADVLQTSEHSSPFRSQIGEYQILRTIGRGGMGIVYDAVHRLLGRRVALKVMQHAHGADAQAVARFQREARVLAKLHHTNIVPLFEVGSDSGTVYHAMQLIDGPGLDAVLRELRRQPDIPATRMPSGPECEQGDAPGTEIVAGIIRTYREDQAEYFRLVARLMLQAAEAVAHAHLRRVLHRDIKPSNLLIDQQLHLWVTDFGLARMEDDGVSRSGDIAGTLRYMAPERFEGQNDVCSDVYSLGVTFYELVTLQPAFSVSDRATLVREVMERRAVSIRLLQPQVPADLETIIRTAMHADPARRYASADRLAEDIRNFLEDRPLKARRPKLLESCWRWCRRNRAVTVLLGTVVAALLLVSWQWTVAIQARRSAENARRAESLATLEARSLAGRLQDEASRLNRAIQFLEEARWLSGQQQWDDAISAYDAAVDLRPEMTSALEERGRQFLKLGLFDLALSDLQSAAQIQKPLLSRQWAQLALLQAFNLQADECFRTWQEMQSVFGGNGQAAVVADLLQIYTLSDHSEHGESPEKMAEFAVSRQNDPRLRFCLAWCRYRTHRDAEAVQLCSELLNESSNDLLTGSVHALKSMADLRMGQTTAARQSLQMARAQRDKVLSLLCEPRDAKWVVHYGAATLWPVAVEEWLAFLIHLRLAETQIEGKPSEDIRHHLLRARSLAALRRMDGAIVEYDLVQTREPENPVIRLEALRATGFLNVEHGRYAEAAAAYHNAVELAPDDPSLWRFLAAAHLAEGNLAGYSEVCLEMRNRFLSTQTGDTALCVVEVCVSSSHGCEDWMVLQPLATMAARHQPDSERFAAALQFRLQQPSECVRTFRNLETVCRLRAADLLVLAMAHHQLGQHTDARRRLSEAVRWIESANDHDRSFLSSENRPRWGSWTEIPETQSLLAEASQLIQPAGL